MSTARSAADTWVVAASLLIAALCWWWIVAMAGDMYGPMTGAAAWMMTRRWDWPHTALLFAMWSAMRVGMMLPSAVAAIVGYGRTQRGTPATPVAPLCAFVAAYVLVWMLFSLAATLAQRVMFELHLLSPMMEPATTALAGGLLLAGGVYQLLPFKRTCLASCRSLAGLRLQGRIVLTLWDSMESIARFAGADPTAAVVEPEAQALLMRFDARVEHFDVRVDARR